jgi:serine/threonine protein kinase
MLWYPVLLFGRVGATPLLKFFLKILDTTTMPLKIISLPSPIPSSPPASPEMIFLSGPFTPTGGKFSLGASGTMYLYEGPSSPVYVKKVIGENTAHETEVSQLLHQLYKEYSSIWPHSLLQTLLVIPDPISPLIVYPLLEGPRAPLSKDLYPMFLHEVQRVFKDMIDALAFLHTKCGLFHGDIHPGNIHESYTPTGEPYYILGDFGLVIGQEATSSFSPMTMRTLLTPEHFTMPPNAHVPPEALSARDSWQLGVTLIRLLTGKFPFNPYDLGDIERTLGVEEMSELCPFGIHGLISRLPTYSRLNSGLPILTVTPNPENEEWNIRLEEIPFFREISLETIAMLTDGDTDLFFGPNSPYGRFCDAMTDLLAPYQTRMHPTHLLDSSKRFLESEISGDITVVQRIAGANPVSGYVTMRG